jgi:hypothetical protein
MGFDLSKSGSIMKAQVSLIVSARRKERNARQFKKCAFNLYPDVDYSGDLIFNGTPTGS